ncbi:MAG: hypothetical protein AB8B53_14705 [Flavobacteriales bacterium]
MASIVGNISFRLSRNAEDVDSIITSTQVYMLSSVLAIPLAIVAILMVKTYNEMDEELNQLGFDEPSDADTDSFEL